MNFDKLSHYDGSCGDLAISIVLESLEHSIVSNLLAVVNAKALAQWLYCHTQMLVAKSVPSTSKLA